MPLYPPASSGGGVTVLDESIPLATTATGLDFTGAGVTASGVGATKTINIPGGGVAVVGMTAATLTGVPYNVQTADVTVTDANIGATSKIGIFWGSVLDASENDPQFDQVEFVATAAAGSMLVRLSVSSPDQRLGGSYGINYLIAA
jgi:hypothetical protein